MSLKIFRNEKIAVVPALLRSEISTIATENQGFLLIYLLNKGYKSNIIDWHNKNPEIPIHCFTDDPEINTTQKIDDTLSFHQLNGQRISRPDVKIYGYGKHCWI